MTRSATNLSPVWSPHAANRSSLIRWGYDLCNLTLGQLVADKARLHGDKPWLHDLSTGRRYSCLEAHLASNRVAHGLLALGILPGQAVAVMMDNRPEFLWVYFALAKIGAVAVPINTAARGTLLADYIRRSDSVAVIADGACMSRLAEVSAELADIRHFIEVQDALPGSGSCVTTARYQDLAAASEADLPPTPRFTDLAQIFFTSGTTGPSKGVMFSHARLMHWCISIPEHMGYVATDTLYVCLPLFHMNGFGGCIVAMLIDGQVALAPRFSASRFWKDVRRSGSTIFNLLGSMAPILWSQPPSAADRAHGARLCQMTPVPSFAAQFCERFGVTVTSGFGLTDFGLATAFTPGDPVAKLGSAGRVRRGIELRIVDDDDFDLGPGATGEIVLRTNNPWEGPMGYYGMPEASLQAVRNGWFHTGDRGQLDQDGYLYFVDRKKDAIRRRGENISSWEVEQVCLRHPAVADAAAYPLRSSLGEDEVAVTLVRRTGAEGSPLTEKDFVEYCRTRMAYYMVPKYVSFADELPRTLTQKVEKYKLQALAQERIDQLWDRERAGIVVRR